MTESDQQNLEAEENVLGSMLLNAPTIDLVQEIVTADDFYSIKHGVVFRALCGMHDRELPVDPVSLADELTKLGQIENAGGIGRIHELAALVPAFSNARHHAKIVSDLAIRRRLMRAGQRIIDLGGGGVPGELSELLGEAEAALSSATLSLTTDNDAVPLSDDMASFTATVREAARTGIAASGALTGYFALDGILGGLHPQQLIVVAARTGAGKSTLALNISENFVDRGEATLFISLEMSDRELKQKAVARLGQINSRALLDGSMHGNKKMQLRYAGAEAKVIEGRTKLYIDDFGSRTIGQITTMAIKHHRVNDIKLLVVDYLQLVTPPKAERHNLAIGEISRGLKQLAKRLNIPIIAVCQLSREGAKGKPELYHLKESSSLEQDADVVILLHDPSEDNDADDTQGDGSINVIVAKNRAGERGEVKLDYMKRYSEFRNRSATGTHTDGGDDDE
ncbi:MAG: AAA family ATPase [Actinobacteria bacterium]|nr:AAA family ATPase [Actinomycetota bacterium]